MLNEAIKPCSTVNGNPSAIAGRWVMHRIDDCFIGALHRDITLLVHNTIDVQFFSPASTVISSDIFHLATLQRVRLPVVQCLEQGASDR